MTIAYCIYGIVGVPITIFFSVDGVIFYTGRARYKGILCTWLTWYGLPNRGICNLSNYCRSANMHNMTICICTISSKPLHQCWLLLQDLSNNNRVRLFWVPGHCNIKGNEEADRLARKGSDSHFCGRTQVQTEACVQEFCFYQEWLHRSTLSIHPSMRSRSKSKQS
jgi:hypothetical protein